MFNAPNFTIRTPQNTVRSPYSIPNIITTPAAQRRNIIEGVAYQGYTFNVVNGASVQNLQIPGDCTEILGFAMSYDTALAGLNNVVTIAINNQTVFNALNLQYFNVNRLLLPPGYIPVNKIVSPTSILNLNFTNGTGAAVNNVNFIVAYH